MLLHKFFTVWLFLLNTHSQAATESRTYYTKDFYIQKVSKNSINEKNWNNYNLSNTTPCRDRIKTIMCLVNPGNPMTDTSPRECQAGGELYAPYFEALYDAYPPILQKMFCSLQVINIEKSFFGTAYAGLIENKDGKILGAHMGIRKSVLDENLNLQTWASWKDQLSFGGISDSYSLTPGLPTIETISPQLGISDFLYFVVAHEFGHILDFSNNLNKMVNCTNETFHQENHPECLMEPSSWGGISWISDERTNLNNDFNHRKDLCFYVGMIEAVTRIKHPSVWGHFRSNT